MNTKLYQILIADDEVEIAQRLSKFITPESGFEVVGTVHNGADALEFIEKHPIDALLTDIQMPYVTGIELAKHLKNLYPKIKLAFISGYDEFTYAKEAIHLDVVSYLLKPIDQQELFIFLSDLKKKLDEEHVTLFNQEKLDFIFKENRIALIENQFNRLIHAPTLQSYDLQRFKVYDIYLEEGQFVTGILEIDVQADFYEGEYLRVFLSNLLNKKFSLSYKVYTFNSPFGLVFIVHNSNIDVSDFESRLQEIVQTKNEYSDILIKIGISEVFSPFTQFQKSIQQAKKALSFSSYLNVGVLIFYRDMVKKETHELKLSSNDLEILNTAIRYGSDEDIHQAIDNLSQLERRQNEKLLINQNYLISIANVILNYVESINLEDSDLLPKSLLDELKQHHQNLDLYDYLEKLVLSLKSEYLRSSQLGSSDLFNEALIYLEKNYMNPNLGMDILCEHLNISVSYLSTLFKKHLDSSFNKELIKIRMEKAKDLLRFSPKKIYEIAQEVGYNDVYYFSHSFKKYSQKTPKDFRNEA